MLLLGTIRLLIFRIFKKKSTKMWLLLKVLPKEKAKKDSVYSIGGDGAKNKVFKFSCDDGKLLGICRWKFERRLSVPRVRSVAMNIPDDLASKLCQ